MTTVLEARQEQTEALIVWAQTALGLTLEEVGAMLSASSRSVMRWRDRETMPQRESRDRLETLAELRSALEQTFKDAPEQMPGWLLKRPKRLGGRTPLQAIREGDFQAVLQILYAHLSGAFV